MHGAQPVQAHAVVDQAVKIQVPPGLRPGDSFIVTPPNGRTFTVVVPEGAEPGSFISVVIPDETAPATSTTGYSRNHVSKAAVGAAVVGGVVGGLVFGTVGAVVLAGGAVYCATKNDNKIGDTVRSVGGGAYSGMASAKNWAEGKLKGSETFAKITGKLPSAESSQDI